MARSKTAIVKRDDVDAEVPTSARTADAALVDGVVEDIRAILAKTVARGMEDVGRLLLKRFFDDNPALYSSSSHAKHASLRLLLERADSMDLPVKRTFLANSLQMAAFSRCGLPRTANASAPRSVVKPPPRSPMLRHRLREGEALGQSETPEHRAARGTPASGSMRVASLDYATS